MKSTKKVSSIWVLHSCYFVQINFDLVINSNGSNKAWGRLFILNLLILHFILLFNLNLITFISVILWHILILFFNIYFATFRLILLHLICILCFHIWLVFVNLGQLLTSHVHVLSWYLPRKWWSASWTSRSSLVSFLIYLLLVQFP